MRTTLEERSRREKRLTVASKLHRRRYRNLKGSFKKYDGYTRIY